MTPTHLDAVRALSDEQLQKTRDELIKRGHRLKLVEDLDPTASQAIADEHAVVLARIAELEAEMHRRSGHEKKQT